MNLQNHRSIAESLSGARDADECSPHPLHVIRSLSGWVCFKCRYKYCSEFQAKSVVNARRQFARDYALAVVPANQTASVSPGILS